MRKIELFTRFLKGFTASKDGVVPSSSVVTVSFESANGKGWTVVKRKGVPPVYPLSISGFAPSAVVGIPYLFTPSVIGGSGVKSFSVSGSLPAGLSFDELTGSISGTPTAAGDFSGISITVADSSGSATLSGISISVTTDVVPLSISGIPEQATAFEPYVFQPVVSGGYGSKSFSLSGVLPDGLSFSSSSGLISGVPTDRGTFSGVSISVSDSSGSAILSGLSFVVANNLPFSEFNSSSFFWDMTSPANTYDDFQSETLAKAVEQVGRKASANNRIKSRQGYRRAGGVGFNTSTVRLLSVNPSSGITNGKSGYLLAFTLKPEAGAGSIFAVSRAGGSTNSRIWVDYTGSRNIRLRYGASDSNTLTTVFTSAQLTLNVMTSAVIVFDALSGVVRLWLNGVEQNLTISGAPFSSFPSSNPTLISIGGNTAGASSFDGVLNNVFFNDGVPSSAMIYDQIAFQETRRNS